MSRFKRKQKTPWKTHVCPFCGAVGTTTIAEIFLDTGELTVDSLEKEADTNVAYYLLCLACGRPNDEDRKRQDGAAE